MAFKSEEGQLDAHFVGGRLNITKQVANDFAVDWSPAFARVSA